MACNTSAKSAEKTRNGRQLSGTGKRSQVDIQRKIAVDEDEPYRPPPGSMFNVFAISFRKLFSIPFCITVSGLFFTGDHPLPHIMSAKPMPIKENC